MKTIVFFASVLTSVCTAQSINPNQIQPGTFQNGVYVFPGGLTAPNIATRQFYPEQYGASGNAKQVVSCSTTASSATIVCPSATFTSADVGKVLVVKGQGTLGTWNNLITSISSVTNSTTIISAVPMAITTASTTMITYGIDDTAAIAACLAAAGQAVGYDDQTENPGTGIPVTTSPVCVLRGNYLQSGIEQIPPGVSIDMSGGRIILVSNDLIGAWQNYANPFSSFGVRQSPNIYFNSLTINGNGFAGVGLLFDNYLWSSLYHPIVLNFGGSNLSGVTATNVNASSNQITVSSASNIQPGQLITIAGLTYTSSVEGYSIPQILQVISKSGSTVTVNELPVEPLTSAAAVTEESAGIEWQSTQVASVYDTINLNNDVAEYFGCNISPYPAVAVNHYAGIMQNNRQGIYMAQCWNGSSNSGSTDNTFNGVVWQYSTMGPEIVLEGSATANNVFNQCYVETSTTNSTQWPMIVALRTALNTFNNLHIVQDGNTSSYWRRVLYTSGAVDLIRPSIEGNLLTGPHQGDQSLVLVDSGGGVDVENLASGSSSYETTPADWIVNTSYVFPAFGSTACATRGTVSCLFGNGASLVNTTGRWMINGVPVQSTGTQTAGKLACIKSVGPPIAIGTCNAVSGSNCTVCN